jgi:hypothetical protein
MLRRRTFGLYCLGAWLLHSVPVPAATPLSQEEQAVVNFGFATQLGSGIYAVSGRTLQVYHLPIGYTLPTAEESRFQVRLKLPVTIGIANFKPIDVIESGLPEDLDSLSVVPGAEIRIAITDRWQLEPFVEAGVARDRTYELDQRVYAGGLRSVYDLDAGAMHWQFIQELLHIVVEQDSDGVDSRDDCTRLQLGTTARRAFGGTYASRRPDYLLYGVADIYTDTPAGPTSGERDDGHGVQFEVGVTFGTVEPMRLGRIPLPRVGLGFRFGEDLSIFRLVFGAPF